jgi:hypothetical protein
LWIADFPDFGLRISDCGFQKRPLSVVRRPWYSHRVTDCLQLTTDKGQTPQSAIGTIRIQKSTIHFTAMITGTLIVTVGICSLVLLGVVGLLYARRKRYLQTGGLSAVIHRYYLKGPTATERQRDLFLTLLCYEDRFPSFAGILEKIAPHFPLTYFAGKPEFRHALDNLVDLADQGMGSEGAQMGERAALASIVRIVIEDRHVHQLYGRELEPLVDNFIEELGIGVAAS